MTYVGIYVSKDKLDLAILSLASGKVALRRFLNTERGRAAPFRLLATRRPQRLVLEASGIYHLPILRRLAAAGPPIAFAKPPLPGRELLQGELGRAGSGPGPFDGGGGERALPQRGKPLIRRPPGSAGGGTRGRRTEGGPEAHAKRSVRSAQGVDRTRVSRVRLVISDDHPSARR